MPVGFMTEATPAGRDGRSAVQVGNRSRSGPEVTAPGGAEMVLHDHMGKPPTPRACQGRAAGQRVHVRPRGSATREKPRAARPRVGGR